MGHHRNWNKTSTLIIVNFHALLDTDNKHNTSQGNMIYLHLTHLFNFTTTMYCNTFHAIHALHSSSNVGFVILVYLPLSSTSPLICVLTVSRRYSSSIFSTVPPVPPSPNMLFLLISAALA